MSINRRRISVSIASGLLLELINKISPLIILHHAQKTLGLVDFGYAQYRIAMLESIQPFITFGFANFALNEAGVKACVPEAMRNIFTHIFWLKILNAVFVTVFLLFSLDMFAPENRTFSQCFVVFLVLSGCVSETVWYILTKHKYAQMNMMLSGLRVGSLLAILYLVKNNEDRDVFVLLSMLPNALMAIFSGWFALKDLKFSKFIPQDMGLIFRKSLPYSLVLIFLTLFDRLDLFLVERWFGLEGAGIYAGPAKIIQSIGLLLTGLAVPMYAEMLKVDDKDDLFKHISLSVWITSILVAPVVFGVPFVESGILNFVFTDLPSTSNHLLGILSVSLLGSMFIVVYGLQLLMSKSRPWSLIVGAALAMIVTVVTTWLTKDFYHLVAVAGSITLGKMVLGVICCWSSRDLIQRFPYAALFKPLTAGFLMAVILTLLNSEDFWVQISAGAVSYMIALALLNLKEVRDFRFKESWARFIKK